MDTGASRACYMWHIVCGMDESASFTNTVLHLTELAPNTKGLWCRVGIRKYVMCAAAVVQQPQCSLAAHFQSSCCLGLGPLQRY